MTIPNIYTPCAVILNGVAFPPTSENLLKFAKATSSTPSLEEAANNHPASKHLRPFSSPPPGSTARTNHANGIIITNEPATILIDHNSPPTTPPSYRNSEIPISVPSDVTSPTGSAAPDQTTPKSLSSTNISAQITITLDQGILPPLDTSKSSQISFQDAQFGLSENADSRPSVHLALESIPSTLAQAQIAATHRTIIQGAIHHTKSSLISPLHTIFNDSEIVVSSTYKHVISISNLTNASAAQQSQTAL
jgi:hypothetical protein